MITKTEIQKIQDRRIEAKKDFKNRCLMVIGALVSEDIIYDDIEKLKTDIYQIAHIATQICSNEHIDWVNNMEKLFNKFEEDGLI